MNSYKQSLYTAIIRIAANIIMVASVFFAMYQAGRWPGWSSETVFCICFFGITIPVWVLAWQLTKWTRRRYPAEFQSLINMPGHGAQLVTWRVLEKRSFFPGRDATFPRHSLSGHVHLESPNLQKIIPAGLTD